jgi:hypothetical protein
VRVAAAVATAVQDEVTATAAVCRTAVKNMAVAVAAENSATAEAAGASTAAMETMGRTATLPTEKAKECRSNGRQVHPCHLSYLSLFSFFVLCSFWQRLCVADNVLELK